MKRVKFGANRNQYDVAIGISEVVLLMGTNTAICIEDDRCKYIGFRTNFLGD